MDALIRFTEKGGFYSHKDIEDYFKIQLPKQDNYFHISSNMKQIKKDDNFYFSYKGEVVAKATYIGDEVKKDENRTFPWGYKIENIKVFNPIKIDNKLFKGQSPFFYINSPEKMKEIEKIEKLIESHSQIREYISSLKINNFTLFNEEELNFSKGINIFIGENGTGKSQILKLISSIIGANNIFYKKKSDKETDLAEQIAEEMSDIFRVPNLQNLISFNFNKKKTDICLNFSTYNIDYSITENSKTRVNINNLIKNGFEQKIVFIPAKEILSNFKRFATLWEEYYISFDKTFYNLVKALNRPLLKDTSSFESINKSLEDILKGEIIQLNGEFYLKREIDKKLIISSMIAEGLRKIGTVSYLLRNKSLNNESILIWDEPESNLNPKLIKEIAKLFIVLEEFGVQIFIATHSLFLVREIEILREERNKIKYFRFGFNDNNKLRVSNGEKPSELEDIVFLDESLSQSSRYLNKKNA